MCYKLLEFVAEKLIISTSLSVPLKGPFLLVISTKESLPLDVPRVAAATSVTDWLLEATKNFQEQLCSWQ